MDIIFPRKPLCHQEFLLIVLSKRAVTFGDRLQTLQKGQLSVWAAPLTNSPLIFQELKMQKPGLRQESHIRILAWFPTRCLAQSGNVKVQVPIAALTPQALGWRVLRGLRHQRVLGFVSSAHTFRGGQCVVAE